MYATFVKIFYCLDLYICGGMNRRVERFYEEILWFLALSNVFIGSAMYATMLGNIRIGNTAVPIKNFTYVNIWSKKSFLYRWICNSTHWTHFDFVLLIVTIYL